MKEAGTVCATSGINDNRSQVLKMKEISFYRVAKAAGNHAYTYVYIDIYIDIHICGEYNGSKVLSLKYDVLDNATFPSNLF